MRLKLMTALFCATMVAPALAQQDASYRKDIEPMMKK